LEGKILVVYGRRGSGKDTFINTLLKESNEKWYKLSLYDPLYRMAHLLTGIDPSTDSFKTEFVNSYNMTGRMFLIKLKKSLEEVHPNLFLNFTANKLNGSCNYYIKDAKSIKELDFLRYRGAKIIRINREEIDREAKMKRMPYNFDMEFNNNETIRELMFKARIFIRTFKW